MKLNQTVLLSFTTSWLWLGLADHASNLKRRNFKIKDIFILSDKENMYNSPMFKGWIFTSKRNFESVWLILDFRFTTNYFTLTILLLNRKVCMEEESFDEEVYFI